MPSPLGHSLAGVCGFALGLRDVAPRRRKWLLVAAVGVANLADGDVALGLLLYGDPRSLHHQWSHSVTAAAVVALATWAVVKLAGGRALRWTLWAGALYASHLFLDLLVDDPSPPYGIRVFWPFSQAYFISPITPFLSFDYYDPSLGMLRTILSAHNALGLLVEIGVVGPFALAAWWIGGRRRSARADAEPPAAKRAVGASSGGLAECDSRD